MNDLSLYLVSVLIWGSTWIAITFQYGRVAPEVSVVYRFTLAALLLAAWCLLRGLKLRFTRREHGWLALQGALMFGINYVCVYLAEQRIPSGLMAVVFSLLAILNLLGARVFFGTPVARKALAGVALGIAGVSLVCLPGAGFGAGSLQAGLGLALGGTVAASLSNLVSQRNQRHGIPVMQGNAVSMAYGAAFVALYCALAGRIGAGRAGYAMVALPVVALALPTAMEGLRWPWGLALGAALCLTGNLLVLPGTRPRLARA